VYTREAHLILYNYIPNLFTSPSLDIAVVKLEAQVCVRYFCLPRECLAHY